MQRERALDPDAERVLAHGERLAGAGALTLDHDSLEDLDPRAGALDHAEVDAHGVARLDPRDLAQLTALDVLDDRAHVERGRRPGRIVAEAGPPLLDRDPVRRRVRREHLPDQVLLRDRAPAARVARRRPVVAHHEVVILRDHLRGDRAVVASTRLDVRLVQPFAVDVHVPLALLPRVAWEPDHALHERAAGATAERRELRRLEDDDVAASRAPEPVAEAAR